MNKKLRWITETAVMLALLIALQALTKPFGQLVTGTCVNAVLAVAVLVGGFSCGITVALISPLCAFLLRIAPNFVTVLPIMLGNVCFVALLRVIAGTGRPFWRQPVALAVAASVKFAVLYLLVVKWIVPMLSANLKPQQVTTFSVMFSYPQIITAIIGGILAMGIVSALRKTKNM